MRLSPLCGASHGNITNPQTSSLAQAIGSTKMMDAMEAKVHQRTVGTRAVLLTAWRSRRFSIDEARRALPYVARVIRDAHAAYHETQFLRQELAERISAVHCCELLDQQDAAIRRLNVAIDECNAVGADLLDFDRGIVRFGAEVAGKPVNLFWQLGDPVADVWTSLSEGAKLRLAGC